MSNPFRGDHVAEDIITSKNMEDFKAFMDQHKGGLLEELAEIDRIAATGDERLMEEFEERNRHFSKPRAIPEGHCLLTLDQGSQYSLCHMCTGVFSDSIGMSKSWRPPLWERYAHHTNLEDLYRAASSGCPLCRLLWMHISNDFHFVPNQTLDRFLRREFYFDYLTFSISPITDVRSPAYLLNFVYGGNESINYYDDVYHLQLCLASTNGQYYVVEVKMILTSEDQDYQLHGGSIALHTGSDATMNFATDHIQRCEQNHKKCSKTIPEGWKPTRLIDLAPLDEPVQPKLLVVDDNATSIAYVTLSHRCGSAEMFRLTHKNIDSLQQRIPLEKLSKTFQDAFITAKKLGMRYVWVDSLCIVQDQADDWQKEAERMKDIYSNARFNISATGAIASDDGLFFSRDKLDLEPFVVKLEAPEGSESWTKGSYYLLDPSMWSSNISKAPLIKRGWVLQERILARRILHFCRNQVFFECHELDACELFPNGLPETWIFQSRKLGAPSSGHFKRLDPELDGGWLRETKSMNRLKSESALNIFSVWAELVETYSSLTLTKWEDKLVAFSGIAKMMNELLADDYLAGLWKRQLPYHLLWSRRQDGGLKTEPMIYIAPSWSWASVQAPVTLHPVTDGQSEDILIDVIDTETYVDGKDVTGTVFGGYIKLKGYLRPAECAVWFNHKSPFGTERRKTCLAMEPGGKPADIVVWPDEIDKFGPENCSRMDVLCLPVHIWRNASGDRCTEGLILEKFDFDQDAFKRIGKFKIGASSKRGERAFYNAPNEEWDTKSAREMLNNLDSFEQRVITII
jgi:hypothetical protein